MKNSKSKTKGVSGPGKVVGLTGSGHSAGTRILSAIEEATEILRAEGLEISRLTIRTYKVPQVPHVSRPDDVRRVRELLGAGHQPAKHHP